MNVLIMHYIDSASEGEKFVLQKFLKKRYDSISEDEISFWLTKIKNKGALENHLNTYSTFLKGQSIKLQKI